IGEALDLSALRSALSRGDELDETSFTEHSWAIYESERSALSETMSQPVLFRIPVCTPAEEEMTYAEKMIASLAAPLLNAEAELLPKSALDDLSRLCERYANIAVNDQLEQYDTALIRAVENGKELLARDDQTLSEIKTACETIENAAAQLKTATESLNDSTSRAKSDQSRNTHLILGFLLVSLLVSAGLAVFMSLRNKGNMDWTR
ncbi:MAG: hypothetical protein II776_06625, partial [Clostridia bacterium]|nr:hypothetical protein [Clostridia bacterium]